MLLTKLAAHLLCGPGLVPVTTLIGIAAIVIDPSAARTVVTVNRDVIANAATPVSMATMTMIEANPSTVLMRRKIHPKKLFGDLRIGAIGTTPKTKKLAAVVIDHIDRTGRGAGNGPKEILVEADDVRDRLRMKSAGQNDWKRASP